MSARAAAAGALLSVLAGGPAIAGCAGADAPCEAPGGTYHLVMPGEVDGPVPVLVFLHGWGSSGEGMVENMGLADALNARGWAFLAPDGTPREGRSGRGWSFHPDRPGPRDEMEFVTGVLDAATRDHGLDPARAVLGGFSIGGSMASYLACDRPEAFAAYVPVGGAFWRPHPEGCAGPVRLRHVHGWRDRTVPLEGRRVGSGFEQGDVFEAMRLWRAANGCDNYRADAFDTGAGEPPRWTRTWQECDPGTALELALFDGGHAVPRGWADATLDWLEGLPGFDGEGR